MSQCDVCRLNSKDGCAVNPYHWAGIQQFQVLNATQQERLKSVLQSCPDYEEPSQRTLEITLNEIQWLAVLDRTEAALQPLVREVRKALGTSPENTLDTREGKKEDNIPF